MPLYTDLQANKPRFYLGRLLLLERRRRMLNSVGFIGSRQAVILSSTVERRRVVTAGIRSHQENSFSRLRVPRWFCVESAGGRCTPSFQFPSDAIVPSTNRASTTEAKPISSTYMTASPAFSLQAKAIIRFGGTGRLGPRLSAAPAQVGAPVVGASRRRASLDLIVAIESAIARVVQAEEAPTTPERARHA